MTKEDKLLLHRYGCFFILLLIMFFALLVVIKLDRGVWNRGLETAVNQVLAQDETTAHLRVIDTYPVKNNTGSSAALYMVGQDQIFFGYALIIRMTGPSGPVSGVFFTKSVDQPPVFLGVADTLTHDEQHRVVRTTAYTNLQLTAAQISFWSDKAAVIFREVLE